MSVIRPATILGGLPVIVEIAFGKDADTPNGAGDYWAEVEHIWWRKRDGSAGKELPAKVYDRAELYDPDFCALIENVSEEMAYEAYEERRAKSGEPDMFSFEVAP